MNKEYKEEAQKFIDELPIEDLFAEIRKVTGLSDLKFTSRVVERNTYFHIVFESQDLADRVGFLKLLFKELYITQSSSYVEYINDDNADNDYDEDNKELVWWGSASFSYTHPGGGSNGHTFLSFRYTKRKGWQIW